MLQSERQDRILEYLSGHEYLTVPEAVGVFGASPATIRRDFDELADKQLVRRIRGGIKPERTVPSGMEPFSLRELRFSGEKELLAREGVKVLEAGNVIFVDGGTTTFHLGLCLPQIDLRVITNSLRLARVLEERNTEKSSLEIYLTGGFLYPKAGILLGPSAEAGLSQYHADWAFLSAGGITEAGLSNTNELVVEAERVMMRNSQKVVVLADHSKVGKNAMCHVCSLEEVDLVITDDWPENATTIQGLRDQGVEVVVCGKAGE
jgi:DeoR/GlpR family transcriptional regulator of sugar metabolism